MARALVTAGLVAEAAQQLVDAGEEPSIIRVQALVGGGSYSTVKRYLDAWRKVDRQRAGSALAVPEPVQQRAVEFAQVVWQEAVARAEAQIAQARADAEREIVQARADVGEAARVIAQLEADADARVAALATLRQERDAARAALDDAQRVAQIAEARREAQGERLAELQQQLAAHAEELTQACAALLAQAHLAGEVEALRRQVAGLAGNTPPASSVG